MKHETADASERYVILGSGRVYPKALAARALVWLLDRLPKLVRDDVLGAYWSPEDIRRMNDRASNLDEFFGSASGEGKTPVRP